MLSCKICSKLISNPRNAVRQLNWNPVNLEAQFYPWEYDGKHKQADVSAEPAFCSYTCFLIHEGAKLESKKQAAIALRKKNRYNYKDYRVTPVRNKTSLRNKEYYARKKAQLNG